MQSGRRREDPVVKLKDYIFKRGGLFSQRARDLGSERKHYRGLERGKSAAFQAVRVGSRHFAPQDGNRPAFQLLLSVSEPRANVLMVKLMEQFQPMIDEVATIPILSLHTKL